MEGYLTPISIVSNYLSLKICVPEAFAVTDYPCIRGIFYGVKNPALSRYHELFSTCPIIYTRIFRE